MNLRALLHQAYLIFLLLGAFIGNGFQMFGQSILPEVQDSAWVVQAQAKIKAHLNTEKYVEALALMEPLLHHYLATGDSASVWLWKIKTVQVQLQISEAPSPSIFQPIEEFQQACALNQVPAALPSLEALSTASHLMSQLDQFDYSKLFSETYYLLLPQVSFPSPQAKAISAFRCSRNLATQFAMNSDFETALSTLELGRKAVERDWVTIQDQGDWHQKMGVSYQGIGEHEQAEAMYLEGIALLESQKERNQQQLSSIYTNLGTIYLEQQQFSQAQKWYELALRDLSPFKDKSARLKYQYTNLLFNLGMVKYGQRHLTEAESYFLNSQVISRQLPKGSFPESGLEAIALAQLKADQNDMEAAEIYLANSLQKILPPDWEAIDSSPYPPLVSIPKLPFFQRWLSTRANIYSQQEKQVEAFQTYVQADSVVDLILKGFLGQNIRLEVAKQYAGIYEKAIEIALVLADSIKDPHYLHTAFQWADRSHSLVLSALSQDRGIRQLSVLPPNVANRLQELEKQQFMIQAQLTNNGNQPVLYAMMLETRRQQDSLLRIVEQQSPEFYRLKYQLPTVSIEALRADLLQGDQAALISYFVGDSSLYAFALTQDTLRYHRWQISSDSLGAMVAQFREQIIHGPKDQYRALGHRLFQHLIQPFEQEIQGKTLYFIRDGALYDLPFDALMVQPEGPHLFEQHPISFGYSAFLLHQSGTQAPYPETYTAVFTPHEAYEDLPPFPPTDLLMSWSEGLRSSERFHVFGNEQATVKNFQLQLPHASQIIFNGHGAEKDSVQQEPYLLFAPEIGDLTTALLSVGEMFALSGRVNHFILNACFSGKGEIQRGEGEMSVGRALRYAGVRSMTLGLWTLPEESTVPLTEAYLKALDQGLDKPTALQKAKLAVLHRTIKDKSDIDFSAPLAWSGVILVGDPRPLVTRWWEDWRIGLGLLLVLAVMGWWRFLRKR
ncbi:MAG: CHAT domain-containing tetratricopeptide repeat protein [Bacteroidota bacterium]